MGFSPPSLVLDSSKVFADALPLTLAFLIGGEKEREVDGFFMSSSEEAASCAAGAGRRALEDTLDFKEVAVAFLDEEVEAALEIANGRGTGSSSDESSNSLATRFALDLARTKREVQ